jgi:hypothetical protein
MDLMQSSTGLRKKCFIKWRGGEDELKFSKFAEFFDYFDDTSRQIISPLAQESGMAEVDCLSTLCIELQNIAVWIATVDGELSTDEAALIAYFNITRDPYQAPDPLTREAKEFLWEGDYDFYAVHWRDYFLKSMLKSPDSFKLQLPMSIRYLQNYDLKKNTEFAQMATQLFVRYAEEIVTLDRKVTNAEETALRDLKSVLSTRESDTT